MGNGLKRFQTAGPSWAERSGLGELQAVLSPYGSEMRNRFIHAVHQIGAGVAASLDRQGFLLDLGCGTGRFLRFFCDQGYFVIGTEITREMLAATQKSGLPLHSGLILTDGISIPVRDRSIDLIWCCAVLRYSLLVDHPVYAEIAQEMHRILKPEGMVVNLEMYVEEPPETFTRDFEQAGFLTEDIRVLQRYGGRMEKICLRLGKRLGLKFATQAAAMCAKLRYRFDNAHRLIPGLRDYLFVWRKA